MPGCRQVDDRQAPVSKRNPSANVATIIVRATVSDPVRHLLDYPLQIDAVLSRYYPGNAAHLHHSSEFWPAMPRKSLDRPHYEIG